MDFEPISEEKKIELLKRAISSEDGWRALAESVKNSSQPNAKDLCADKLRQLAGDKEMADMLVQKLEENIALVELTK